MSDNKLLIIASSEEEANLLRGEAMSHNLGEMVDVQVGHEGLPQTNHNNMKSKLSSLMLPFALMAGLNEPVYSVGGRKYRVNWKSYGPGNSQRKRRKYGRQNPHSKYAI